MLRLSSFVVFIVFNILSVWAQAHILHAADRAYLIMPEVTVSDEKNFSEEILPKSITSADTSQSVVSKIIDNSLAYLWRNSELKNTSIGRTAEKVEKNLKGEVYFSTNGESKTEHKLSFKLLAMQALAKLEYKGWIQAAINYDVGAAKTEAEIVENISEGQDLLLSHSVAASESESKLSLRWEW